VSQKLRSDSFAARLSRPQKDELFEFLAEGGSYKEAAGMVHDWTKAEWGGKPPSTTAIGDWFTGAKVERKFSAAKEAALVAEANSPEDVDEKTRRAFGQARFMMVLQEMSPMDFALLEKNEIARQKLELDRIKVANDRRVSRRDLVIERMKNLLQRAKGGEKSQDLQSQIDLALDEIEKMKHGDDAS
jgi:hypothetical protein